MYYHNQPTPQLLTKLKALKAREMQHHIQAMKRTTKKYDNAITELETIRALELQADAFITHHHTTEAQRQAIDDKIKRNHKKAEKIYQSFIDEYDDLSTGLQ